ncbi:hypothetical protein SAMN05444169_4454 [Bradyrhizobium erythrophlei]|uniref:Uncharacterized protein n=1 Tax=Bradyrhizobium erythrophlei TaxID=1437360 RepID=A0A1M5N6X1_9BRAD|nr:hypothetical protein SAMN05444169_4454 [Bradyrhizobium erythrophlei]
MTIAVIPGRAKHEPGISMTFALFFRYLEIPGLVLPTIPE